MEFHSDSKVDSNVEISHHQQQQHQRLQEGDGSNGSNGNIIPDPTFMRFDQSALLQMQKLSQWKEECKALEHRLSKEINELAELHSNEERSKLTSLLPCNVMDSKNDTKMLVENEYQKLLVMHRTEELERTIARQNDELMNLHLKQIAMQENYKSTSKHALRHAQSEGQVERLKASPRLPPHIVYNSSSSNSNSNSKSSPTSASPYKNFQCQNKWNVGGMTNMKFGGCTLPYAVNQQRLSSGCPVVLITAVKPSEPKFSENRFVLYPNQGKTLLNSQGINGLHGITSNKGYSRYNGETGPTTNQLEANSVGTEQQPEQKQQLEPDQKRQKLLDEEKHNALAQKTLSALIKSSPPSPPSSSSSSSSLHGDTDTYETSKQSSALVSEISKLAVVPQTICHAFPSTRILSLAVLNRSDLNVVAAGSVTGTVAIARICNPGVTAAEEATTTTTTEVSTVGTSKKDPIIIGSDDDDDDDDNNNNRYRECIYRATVHERNRAVAAVSFGGGGSVVYSAGYDGACVCLDVETGKQTLLMSPSTARCGKYGFSAMAMRRDCDSPIVYCGTTAGALVVLDSRLPKDSPVAARGCHSGRIMSLECHSADSNLLLSASINGTAAFWDLRLLLDSTHPLCSLNGGAAVGPKALKGIRGCLVAYTNPPLVAATASPVSEVTGAPVDPLSCSVLVTTADGLVAIWDGVGKKDAGAESSFTAGIPKSVFTNPNKTPNGPVYFRPSWSINPLGLAAVGCLNNSVALFEQPATTAFKYTITDPLITSTPIVNVFHPCHEWSLFSGTADGTIYHWMKKRET